jgi:guanylate kinase
MKMSPYQLDWLHNRITNNAVALSKEEQVELKHLEREWPHIAIIGASGSGKSTLIHKEECSITKQFPSVYSFSVSGASRQPRKTEVHSRDYFFFDGVEAFQREVFLEDNVYEGNKKLYGTLRREVERIILQERKRCCFDVDPNGGKALKQFFGADLFLVYLQVSIPVLEKRLKGRQTETGETNEQIANRLLAAEKEAAMVASGEIVPDFMLPYDDVVPAEAINQLLFEAKRFNVRSHTLCA